MNSLCLLNTTGNYRLALTCLLLFLFTGCATTKHVGNFNYYPRQIGPKANYVILNDGKKVTGARITWSSVPSRSSYIAVDNQRFRDEEVKAVSQGGMYFLRHKSGYLKRIVAGNKLNVYSTINRTSIVEGQYESPGHTYIVCWMQRGNDGQLFRYTGATLLAEEVRGCELAYGMANKSRGEIRTLTRDDPDYLNKIVEIYNNDCKPLETGNAGR